MGQLCRTVITSYSRRWKGEYTEMATEWSDAWAVMSDSGKFAAKFNSTVPGAVRPITGDDVRQLAHCGLIGRRGFFERADMETIRGILWYENIREKAGRRVGRGLGGSIMSGEPDETPDATWADAAEGCLESCGV